MQKHLSLFGAVMPPASLKMEIPIQLNEKVFRFFRTFFAQLFFSEKEFEAGENCSSN